MSTLRNDILIERASARGLSVWQLGDLLGIHPHLLHSGDDNGGLNEQPVRVLIDLARQIDVHPADIVRELDSVLRYARLAQEQPPFATRETGRPDARRDALTVLTALASAANPLDRDTLADALSWQRERVAAALECIQDHPDLAGPVALRRTDPYHYTLGPRLDLLTEEQRKILASMEPEHPALSTDEFDVLYAAVTSEQEPRDAHAGHDEARQRLRTRGLVRELPTGLVADADVLYSLGYHHPLPVAADQSSADPPVFAGLPPLPTELPWVF